MHIVDILHQDAGCTRELLCAEPSSGLLCQKVRDDLDADQAAKAEQGGKPDRARPAALDERGEPDRVRQVFRGVQPHRYPPRGPAAH